MQTCYQGAKLASLMEQAWGCLGTLCRETEVHLSQQLLSEKGQQRRLQHMMDGAVLTEMVKQKAVQAVAHDGWCRAHRDGKAEACKTVQDG